MTRLISISLLASLVLAGCADDSDGPANQPNATDNSSRTFRATEATTEVITLSAESSAAFLAGTQFGPIAAAEDCGATTGDLTSMTIDFSGCPGMSGSLQLTLSDPDCLLGDDLDPTCLDNLAVDVVSNIEMDGIRITGDFSTVVGDDSIDAVGSVDVDIPGDELSVDFDLQLTDDGLCDSINGTLEVATAEGNVSVTANNLVDCGDCPESGSLEVSVDGQSTSIDFDAGTIDIDGDALDLGAELSCDLAL